MVPVLAPGDDVLELLAARARNALVRRPAAAATRTVPLPGGIMVLTADFPLSHEHNKALITDQAEPAAILDSAELVATEAGLDHVRVDALAGAPARELAELGAARGYRHARELVMVLPASTAAALTAAPPHPQVREVPWDRVRASVHRTWQASLPEAPPVVWSQLTQRREATARGVDVRHLAAIAEPDVGKEAEVLARAELYLTRDAHGLVAQVESVDTEPHARRRGLARAVVTAAVALAHRAGASATFLVADADDWPREFYARMGFVARGTTAVLSRSCSG